MAELKNINGAVNIVGELSMGDNTLINAQLAVNSTTVNAANKLEVHGQARVNGTMMIGNSSISNTTNTGQLHIKNTGGAIIRLEDSDNSNLAFDLISEEGVGFMIKETVGGDSGDDIRLTIAESTGNATFAGTVTVPTDIIHSGDTDTMIRFTSDNIRLQAGGNNTLELAGANATFAGSVTTSGTINVNNAAADKKLSFDRTGGKGISIEHDSNGIYFYNETDSSVMFRMYNAGNIQTSGEVEGGSLDINGNADISGTLSGNFVVRSTNNANADGANFAVDTTNKSSSEYAYEVLRSGTTVAGITMVGKITGTELEGTSLDINGNGDVSGTLTANVVNMGGGDVNGNLYADRYLQAAHGYPTNNLGSPTVTEMALFENQFKPQTTLANSYNNLADLTFFTRASGTGESDFAEVTSYSDDQKRKFLRTNNSTVVIPNGHNAFRIEFVAPNYVYANAMVAYWSSQSHSSQVHVWKRRCDNNTWYQHTSSTATVSSWPGHLYLPFGTIPWHETNTTSSSHYNKIRIEFTNITWSTGTYSDRVIALYGMQIWGGYPSGRRTVHYYDQNGKLNLFGNLDVPGTIYNATWDGDVIQSSKLDADTAHLSTTQTFSGSKTFSALASFTMDGNTITGIDDSGEFTDDDSHIMTSAGANDRFTNANNLATGTIPAARVTDATYTQSTTVTTGTDWDTLTSPGTYKVASSSGAQFTGTGRPITAGGVEPDYRYGHVHVTEATGQGIQQTYYPHQGAGRIFNRTGWSGGSWAAWAVLYTSKTGVILDGNIITGIDDSGEFTNDDAHIMTSAAIEDKILSYGYGTGGGSGDGDVTLAGTQTFTGSKTFGAATQFNNTVTVGADTSGHDVKFYGNDTGEYMHWDESTSKLNIRHDHEDCGLSIFTVSSAQNTVPQIQIGRDSFQYWGVYVDDRNAHMVHRQDETSGIMTTRFDQWDSNTSDTTGSWLWRYGDGTGGSMATALTLTQAGDATFAGDVNLVDSKYIKLGTGEDFEMHHNGVDTIIGNQTGDLKIRQFANDKDIIFDCDDGAGGVTEYFRLDGGSNILVASVHQYMLDNKRLYLGTGSDLELYHDASNSYIRQQGTGSLIIEQTTDDGDIILKSDDGSGGTTAYITLDGGLGYTTAQKAIKFLDDTSAYFGNSQDLEIVHTSNHSYVYNNTGNLTIANRTDDGDIIFQSDDGSGGVETYFYLDGGQDSAFPNTVFPDQSYLSFGNSNDLRIAHNGADSYFFNTTGDLIIENYADDKDIIFRSDDGSGGVKSYFYLDGSIGATIFPDSASLGFGTGGDMYISHDATNTHVTNFTGDLYITNKADDKDVILRSDDGSGGVTPYITLDGSDTAIKIGKELQINGDNRKLKLGASGDLQIYHTGTDSWINNATGNVIFVNNADDKDIIFYCDDGSGGVTPYFQLDGGLGYTVASKRIRLNDSVNLGIGSSNDLDLYHNATNSFIENWTGDLYIRNNANDKNIYLQSDDGSGGVATYIYLDGVNTMLKIDQNTRVADSKYFAVGSGSDLQLSHNGSNSSIVNYTGHLYITNAVDDSDVVFQCDDGSGGVTPYITLDGGATNVLFSVDTMLNGGGNYIQVDVSDDSLKFADNAKIKLGTGNDLQIHHDGTNSVLYNGTGDLYIKNEADDKDIIFQCDNGSGGTAEYFRVDGSLAEIIFSRGTRHMDNKKATFGSSQDLQIYHDGSNSYIEDAGTGDLILRSNAAAIRMQHAGEMMLKTVVNGAVELYHNNVKKFETKANGVNTTYSIPGTTDGTHAGDIVYFSETSTTAGRIYYYTSSGAWELADADAVSSASGMLAVALGSSSATHGMLLRGMVTLNHDPGAVGDTLFLSTAVGQATATAPSGNGDIVRVIGYCLDASNGQIWFNPDGAFVEVTAG